MRSALVIFIILVANVTGTHGALPTPAPVTFSISALPRWVKPVDAPKAPNMNADNGGILYLLIDRQHQVEPRAYYRHEVRQITSEAGVQNGAAISTSFDPAFQKLSFHSIRVTRNGVITNRLVRSQIQLLRREKNMEDFLYDGSYTAQCELEDVRVGDVIEFAYTVEGANPIKKGKFSTVVGMQWSYPVQQTLLRIVCPATRKLQFLPRNRAITGRETTAGGIREWIDEDKNLPARKVQDDTPSGYDPQGWLQISEYRSWSEVVDWALVLFRNSVVGSPEVKAEIDRLAAIAGPEKRTLAALRFVQDEIRYLGIESGIGSHQPSPPNEVLRRRFGDCKDKALLLTTMLRGSGIDATPALVSYSERGTVVDWLPSPDAFDHVIVRVRLGPETYWLDATRSHQRGPLRQIYITNFGQALLLEAGNGILTPVARPRESWPRKKIVENLFVPRPGEAGALEVVSEYRGAAADKTRAFLRENGREGTQKVYREYYARQYPEIEVRELLIYQELEGENGCSVSEFYRIPHIWELDTAKENYELSLYPGEIDHAMGSPVSSQRDDPLGLDYPVDVVQEINLRMFEDWPIEAKLQNVENAFFHYREEANGDGKHLHLSFSFATLADRVPVPALATYNAALSEVKEKLGYNLTYTTPEQLKALQKTGHFNWLMGALWICFLAFGALLSFLFVRTSRLQEPLPLPVDVPLSRIKEGFGGWLGLVALHQVLRPFGFISIGITLYSSIFNLETWRLLTNPGNPAFHPYWAPTLLFELIFNSASFVFSILLLILFFKKRAVWPRSYAFFLLLSVVGVCLDVYLTRLIPAAKESLAVSVRSIVQILVPAMIWIPYCFLSKRVKATFRY